MEEAQYLAHLALMEEAQYLAHLALVEDWVEYLDHLAALVEDWVAYLALHFRLA